MGKRYSLKTNFLYNISYEIFRIVIPLISTPYISRILGSEGIGAYTLAHTYAEYFIMFAGFGFSTYAARELAYVRDEEDRLKSLFWEVFIARGGMLCIAVIVYIWRFFVEGNSSDLSSRICLIYLIASLFDISYYYKAIENFRAIAIRNMFIKIVALVLVFVFVKYPDDVWIYTLILALSEFVGQFVMILSLDKSIFHNVKINLANLKRHFRVSFTLFIPTIAIQVYTMLDKVMLGVFSTESEVGYYENAQKIPRLAASVASAIVSVTTPRMAYVYAKKDKGILLENFKRVFGLVSFLVFPMCFGLVGVSKSFSSWFYGVNFDGIDILVKVGSILIISLGWSGIFGNMILVATGNQKYYTISVYISAAVNMAMNVLLIPRYGAMGALIASVCAEVIGMIIMFYFSNRKFHLVNVLTCVPKYLCSSVFLMIILLVMDYFMRPTILTTIMQLGVGGVFYFVLMLIIKDENLNECISYARRVFTNIISHR